MSPCICKRRPWSVSVAVEMSATLSQPVHDLEQVQVHDVVTEWVQDWAS